MLKVLVRNNRMSDESKMYKPEPPKDGLMGFSDPSHQLMSGWTKSDIIWDSLLHQNNHNVAS